ncbi:hypothetical protein FACS18949_12030 [Clostridia bacterium]|nr:hypothetical protein FACS18949_12030 [Clostridia bacterium]
MNSNIEVISNKLYAVKFSYLKAGYINELPLVDKVSFNEKSFASLTDDGTIILNNESPFYPFMRLMFQLIMLETDSEFRRKFNFIQRKQKTGKLNGEEEVYQYLLQIEKQRREKQKSNRKAVKKWQPFKQQ